MIKVIIADDHAIVRRGLMQILEVDETFSLVSEASDGAELISKLNQEKYHVVVLDLNMPGRNGLDLIKDIKDISENISILILSVNDEKQIVKLALQLGALGYVTKESAPQELVHAIRKVYYGEKYISPELAEKLVFEFTEEKEELPHEKLSIREYQTLCLIGSGKSLKSIAEDMKLSIKTISTYKTRIQEKMNLKDKYDIIKYVSLNKLIT